MVTERSGHMVSPQIIPPLPFPPTVTIESLLSNIRTDFSKYHILHAHNTHTPRKTHDGNTKDAK